MRGTRVAAALAALTLLLSGCSDDEPMPRVEPSASPTPTSTTTSPSVEPSDTPDALTPTATVRAWVEARNEAMRTGDTSDVVALSAPACSSCRDLNDPIVETFANGGRYETTGWRVLNSKLQSESPTKVQISTALALAGGATYASADAAPVEYPSEKRIAIFELTSSEQGWLVSLIGFVR